MSYQSTIRHERTLKSYTAWKKSIWKDYILYESNQVTFQKRQNSGDKKKMSDYRGLGKREGGKAECRRSLGKWTCSVWDRNEGICHYTLAETHRLYNTKSDLLEKRWTLGAKEGSPTVRTLPLWWRVMTVWTAVSVSNGVHMGILCTFHSIFTGTENYS